MSPTYPFPHREIARQSIDRADRLPHFVFEPGELSLERWEELIDATLRDEHGILAEFPRERGLPKG